MPLDRRTAILGMLTNAAAIMRAQDLPLRVPSEEVDERIGALATFNGEIPPPAKHSTAVELDLTGWEYAFVIRYKKEVIKITPRELMKALTD